MQFLDPKVDLAFKKLFGSEDHKRLTIAFLNAILEYHEGQRIVEIEFMNNEQQPLGNDKKENILDIFCTDQSNHQYIIEMQNAWEPGFSKRMLWYGAKAYATQLKAAKPYHDLDPIVIVAITRDFKVFPKKNAYKSIHEIHDRTTNEHDIKDLTLVFVELLKFNKKEHELVTNEDKWLFLLKEIRQYNHVPEPLKQAEFDEACQALNRMSWSDSAYDAYEKTMIKAQAQEETARLLLKSNEFAEQARLSGLAEGKAEGKAEIARKLLKEMNIEKVAQITGLSIQDIEALKS